MHAGVTRITIDVDLSANPIEGTLRSGDGVVREFTGYMQLITAFEDVVDTARDVSTPLSSRVARIAGGRSSSSARPASEH